MSKLVDALAWNHNWESLEKIGEGGQGVTHKARNKHTGVIACVKVLNKVKDPERRARFYREAVAYDTCSIHGVPSLVETNAHQHESPDFKPYIVTDFLVGPTLTEKIEENGPLTFEEAIFLTQSLLDVVSALHRQGWVHRDIKPDNIILKNGNPATPVLLDFGLCYKDEVTPNFETELGQEIGNRFLRLPELTINSKEKQDSRSDLTLVAGVMFYAMSGVIPATLADGSERSPHQREFEALKESSGKAFARLLAFFDRAMRLNISQRFISAEQMKSNLKEVLSAVNSSFASEHEENMDFILARAAGAHNPQRIEYFRWCESALGVVDKVHRHLSQQVKSVCLAFQGGAGRTPDGRKANFGFSIVDREQIRFEIKFLAEIVGAEIIVKANDAVLYRTDINDPDFSQPFEAEVEALFARRVRGLLEEPPAITICQDSFKEKPLISFEEAQKIAHEKERFLFLVIYDEEHKNLSGIGLALGYFMEYEVTKELVAEHFVVAIVDRSQVAQYGFVSGAGPLEAAHLVIISPQGETKLSEGVYANPEEGKKRIYRVLGLDA